MSPLRIKNTTLRLSQEELREEPRLLIQEFESFTFQTSGMNSFAFEAVIYDKSNSGLGCFCSPNWSLKPGLRLKLWDMMVYEVRYAQHLSDHVMKLGLKLLKELD
jgi:hypothetical protein